ncbi:methyltransferase domain-containing protein [Pseudoruegeria sp. HB172150]|uniref:methyltransferase domain-containing protein n=1 Tax=Pseudoruegeria sp. HB172150 TaxID=2721164 RepID=UPI00155763EE|nr:methyltransferase domain-containing protein [Pseudoruegeria sp. HB172150]
MHLDVLDLRNFYYRTGLGRAVQRSIRAEMLGFWPAARNETVVGFGFAAPLLRPYLTDAERVIALMPGQQGVMPWPSGQPNLSVLCEETFWPLQTGLADKLVLLHGLETSENPTKLLEECRRVLAPGGKALFIVPNRAGLWARRDQTPFGFGRPFSLTQLETQLERHAFEPTRNTAALYQPPFDSRFWLKTGGFWEKTGRKLSMRFAGGVLIVEATRQVKAPTNGLKERVRRPLRVLEGLTQPEPNPNPV